MITTILWDMDDTLLDFLYSEHEALVCTFQNFGINISEDNIKLYSGINDSYWKMLERKEISLKDLDWMRFRDFFELTGFNLDPHVFSLNYKDELGLHYRFVPGAKETLDLLINDYDLYLVTNGTAKTQRIKINRSGLGAYMKDIFISEEIGYSKPSVEYMNYVLSCINEQNPEHILIVGDSLTSDILGGKNAGIKTCLFQYRKKYNECDICPDLLIHSLLELCTRIKEV